jgi:GMP synthase (glutamine-hydrolysing)
VASTGVNLHVARESERFLDALAGVSDPETKRKIIGREFIRAFEAAEEAVLVAAADEGAKVTHLVQGSWRPTSRTSSLNSSRRGSTSSNSRSSGSPPTLWWDFRIIGEVTSERLEILRRADAIAREELTESGLDQEVWHRGPRP